MSDFYRPDRPQLLAGPGRLIVLSGPSGVGKDTVLRELFKLDPTLRYSVSYTTRPKRPDERDGESYTFVDEATFNQLADKDRREFLEWAIVFGHLYGTSLKRVQEAVSRGEDIVLKIDVQGAARVRKRVAGEATFIFLLPPSLAELRRRLTDRGTEDNVSIELRYATARTELGEKDKYEHQIVNDDVHRTARQILDIIEEDRKRRAAEHSVGSAGG
jgi:guanylate kinase